MPWGKIDDALDEDPRVMRMMVEEGEAGMTAMGLWGVCFVWANRNTRKRGKTPGLLPPMLPMSKMGPRGMVFAALLEKHELWAPVGPGGGWLIVDFADTLPTKDVSSKRAEAGRRGAAKRWAAKRAAEAAAAAAAGMANDTPGDGKLLQPDGIELPGDGSDLGVPGDTAGGVDGNRVLPDGYIRLPSVCHAESGENGSNEPSDDGTLPSPVHPNGGVDNSEYGTLLSLDGSLPGLDRSLLRVDGKTAPQSQSPSQSPTTKDSPPADAGGVIAWPGSPSTKKRRRRDDSTPEFETAWTAYGQWGTPRDAAKEWHAAIERGATPADITAAIPGYVASRPEQRYRKHFENWLAGDCWKAAVAAPVRAVSGGYGRISYREPDESVYRHTRI